MHGLPVWFRGLASGITTLLLTAALHAQPVVTAFSYQAYVEFDGAALDERADFRFTLWDDPEQGNPIGSPVDIDDRDVVNGLLSVELDFGRDAFDGEARWLEVEVRAPTGVGDFEILSPRRLVTAAPSALHALSGTPGPQGPEGPQGPPGDSVVAGQVCPSGQQAIGFTLDGDLICASANACAGVVCQAHQTCELLPGPGGQEVAICVDSCQGFDCPAGSTCELREVACVTAPCPPVAVCTMMPGDPQDPCAGVTCGATQECKVFDNGTTQEAYCADTCSGIQCPGNQVCKLQPVSCVRAPCPPVARCVDPPRDPCDGLTCSDNQRCEVFEPGDGTQIGFCADTCDGVRCPQGEQCELVDVHCITAPCPPIAQCRPAPVDVCGLPIDRGPCRALIPRWGHNPDTGRCERFNWGGCGGNDNNYETRAQCEQACGAPDACTLDPARGPCDALLPRWYHDEDSGRCRRFNYGGCGGNDNNFASQAACEAACRPDSRGQCELPADSGPCRALIPRWHHDPKTGRCEEFAYGGCGGNDNNYATRAECERTCDVDVDVCELDADPGPCRAFIPQWHHDPATGQCEKFVYGGCGGNDNRYDTRAECERACDVDVDVCALPADTGPCHGFFPRWHHDATDGRCERFIYGGCGGNENNFETQGECREACGSTVDVCELPADVGPCNALIPRWHHDPATGQCAEFDYGGCGGNPNNFTSQAECEQACEVAPPDVCTLPVDSGPCDAYIPRWHHDAATGECERFIYGGCGGNGNNFTTEAQCQRACGPRGGD